MPEVRYAKSVDLHIAYQVLGQGDLDLVLVPEWASNIESFWQEPGNPPDAPSAVLVQSLDHVPARRRAFGPGAT